MAVVRVIDHGLKAALQRTSALGNAGVKVGYQADSGRSEGVDVLDIAVWNHFGTKHIPARPFLFDASVKYEQDMGTIMAHLALKVQNGQASVDAALRTTGEAFQARVTAQIRSGDFTPNAESTIRMKGSSVPLVDMGRTLIPGLRYEVLK